MYKFTVIYKYDFGSTYSMDINANSLHHAIRIFKQLRPDCVIVKVLSF